MRFDVLTIFPEIIDAYSAVGIIGRAQARHQLRVETVNIRDYATDRYRSVDDEPFGGGAGMVMTPEPIARAFDAAPPASRRVLLAPYGRPFQQRDALALARLERVQLLCGRYEGIDERVVERYIDDVISLGDFVLTGGELAALVVIDATARLLPGVLGNAQSAEEESFSDQGLLEHPHYTRPAEWRGVPIPEVLLSGHHARITAWRRAASIDRTLKHRPELLNSANLTAEERRALRPQQGVEESDDERLTAD
ncbi:tRNA (guanosine(37)-N1)-methyltransferase TrmD [Myxococcota bacterium]|nr:tRNA (guanosine(37)-N1)-methyltransferase TrmD [Myxococcota bacterium]MBU1432800.1 tRNA (guanosine(37)-N1)-methyltransferase TrmD [Myxococcota bacterium]MBU1897295.1 tRNA (guanosine(37)-N1)-methyltransferase TrmD [Myxococcota bacterium]